MGKNLSKFIISVTLNLTRSLAGISYYRNPIIAQMLKDYKFAEKAGRGLQKILKFYKENKLKPPDFELTVWTSGLLMKVLRYTVKTIITAKIMS